jgi:hypothetical protein
LIRARTEHRKLALNRGQSRSNPNAQKSQNLS